MFNISFSCGPKGEWKMEKFPVKVVANTTSGINWYINLKGNILNVGDLSQQGKGLFTGELAETQQLTVAMDAWKTAYSDFYTEEEAAYGTAGLVGNDSTSAEAIDAAIDALMASYVKTYPGDSNILAVVKTYLDGNGRTIQTVSGKYVDKDLLTKDCYDVQWYVLKRATDDNDNPWHVDGVLVNKAALEEQLTLRYELVDGSADLPDDAPALPYNGENVYYTAGKQVVVGLDETTEETYSTEDISDDQGTYSFSGWYMDEELKEPAADFKITDHTILYGMWTFTAKDENPSEGEDPNGSKDPNEGEDPNGSKDPSEGEDPNGSKDPSEGENPNGSKDPSEGEDPNGSKDPTEGDSNSGSTESSNGSSGSTPGKGSNKNAGSTAGVTIEELETPLTDLPVAEASEERNSEESVLESAEEEIPMAHAPETGDASLVWALLSAASSTGLVWMSVSGRKKEEA